MKKILLITFSLILIPFFSCGEKKKKASDTITKTIALDSLSVHWVGYKTNEKIGVKGSFEKVNFENTNSSDTLRNVFDGLKVTIPVSSLFSGLEDRDEKLINIFFGTMLDTEIVSGDLYIEDDKNAVLILTMNSQTKELPLLYTVNQKQDKVVFYGKMDLDNWGASDAVKTINEACYDLHKGSDGVSKTWNQVDIEVEAFLETK